MSKKVSYIKTIFDGVIAYLEDQGHSPATIKDYKTALYKLDKFCESRGGCPYSIEAGKDFLAFKESEYTSGKIKYKTWCAVRRTIAMSDEFFLAGSITVLLYDTAARCQEMLDLRIRDFVIKKEPGSSFVYLTGKGDKTRAVPLMDKTVGHLRQYLKFFHPEASRSPDDYLFYTVIHGARNQMSPDTVAYFIHKYAVRAHKENPGVPVKAHPHMFRHTRAIHLYRSGYPLSLLSEYLGHEQDSTTRIYAQASVDMKAEALCKASNPENIPDPSSGLWEGDRETIKKLYGLK